MDHIIKIFFSERQHYISFHAFITQSSDVYWEVLNCEEFGCLLGRGREIWIFFTQGFPVLFRGGKFAMYKKKEKKISFLLTTFWKNSWAIKELSATHGSDVLFYSQNCLGLFLFFFSFFYIEECCPFYQIKGRPLGIMFFRWYTKVAPFLWNIIWDLGLLAGWQYWKKWSNTFEVFLEARAEIITKNSMNLLVDLETPN